MNFLNPLMTSILLIGFVLNSARAQEPSPHPVPTEPFLAKLRANTSWVMNYSPVTSDAAKPSDEAASPPATPATPALTILSITVVRNAGLRREITLWSDQSQTEKWIFKNIIFTQYRGKKEFSISSAELSGIDANYPDFPQLVWIDKDHFQSVEEKDGKSCFLYFWSESGLGFRPLTSPIPIVPTKVWVSLDSKLPVVLEDEHVKVTFDYDQPLVSLVLPAQCKALLAELSKTEKRLDGQQMVRP